MIYFIQPVNDPNGPVKIGYSKNPEKRLKKLRLGSPKPLHIKGLTDYSICNIMYLIVAGLLNGHLKRL